MHCFLWEELSFRYAGASADAPAYHFYREGFCSNRSVMLRRLMPRVERLCSMALVAGGQDAQSPQKDEGRVEAEHKAVIAAHPLLQGVGNGF